MPVPVRLTAEVAPLLEVLLRVSEPVSAAAVVGANLTETVNDWPTASVCGHVPATSEKPVPAIDADLTSTVLDLSN